jgi:hypothetical protein
MLRLLLLIAIDAGCISNDPDAPSSMAKSLEIPKIEPLELKSGKWSVLMTWRSGAPDRVAGFDTEDSARLWIKDKAAGWIQRHRRNANC